MFRPTTACLTLGLLLAFTPTNNAQREPNAGLFEPRATWSWYYTASGSGCVTGLNRGLAYTGSDSNGTFTEPETSSYKATWQVNCGQRNTKAVFEEGGTTGSGISACFRGCSKRPGCLGFFYVGTVSGGTGGSGLCSYQRATLSNYDLDTTTSNQYGTLYAGVHMLTASADPRIVCPYYNGTTFQDGQGNTWAIYCQRNAQGAITVGNYVSAPDMGSCFQICNDTPGCTMFEYQYPPVSAEPAASTVLNNGRCYLKDWAGFPESQIIYTEDEHLATRLPATLTSTTVSSPVSTPTTPATIPTTATTASASAAPINNNAGPNPYPSGFTGTCTTTGAVSPATPACAAANQTQFTSPCGSVYTVYCGFDSSPSSVSSQTVSGDLAGCMAACDAYAGCQAATLQGTTCYLKTGFSSLSSNGGVNTVIRSIPPNPNFAFPPPAGSVNASRGCNQPLPAGLTPNGASGNFTFTGSDGFTRWYLVHIPQYYYSNRASPLILGFHGQGASASNIEGDSKYNDGTRNPYGIAVYITGVNAGYISNPDYGPTSEDSQSGIRGLDDISFVRALVNDLLGRFCIDTGRIWATGYSNGGGLVQVLACDPVMSSTISVFTGMSAAMYTNNTNSSQDPRSVDPVNTPVQATCNPSRNNVAYMEIHGLADGTIAYAGGFRKRRILPEIPWWASSWAFRQGYSRVNTTMATGANYIRYGFGPTGNPGIITQITILERSTSAQCNHCWSNASPQGVDASTEFMNFFYDQTRTWGNTTTPTSSTLVPSATSSSAFKFFKCWELVYFAPVFRCS